jgi:hypothetical protein
VRGLKRGIEQLERFERSLPRTRIAIMASPVV